MSEMKENLSEREPFAGYEQGTDMNGKLIANMRELNHTMRALYEGKASQKRVLVILKEAGNITQRDLTARLGIRPGSVSEILSKLENAGLIQRVMSEEDRRTADISLTDRGMQLACEAAGQRSRRHCEMFSCLEESEKEELLTLLEKINADWGIRYGAAVETRRGRHPHDHECEHGREGRHCNGHGHRHGTQKTEGDDHGKIY